MIEQVFMNFRVQNSEFFSTYAAFCSLFYQILHTFLSKLVKNLMPGQNAPPKT